MRFTIWTPDGKLVHDSTNMGGTQWARPKNLRIGGTVNMDETTHPFSDKVLDRAFTLEFWDVDLKTYLARRPKRQPKTEEIHHG